LDRETVTVNDSHGFVAVRLAMVLINEAAKLVYEGVASPEDIDKECRLGLGHAMGLPTTLEKFFLNSPYLTIKLP